jgi:hypothetical protein
MAPARYEVRVNGALSERARDAFSALDVRSVPPQTIVFGELAEQSVWVPRTRSPHATVHVFVDEAAESVSSKDADGRAGTWRAACGRSLIQ